MLLDFQWTLHSNQNSLLLLTRLFFHYTMHIFLSQPNDLNDHEDCGQVFNYQLDEMPHPDTFNPAEGKSTFVD